MFIQGLELREADMVMVLLSRKSAEATVCFMVTAIFEEFEENLEV